MKQLLYIPAILVLIGLAACKDNNPKPEDPQELITTLKITFTDSANTGNIVSATFSDPDGPGGSNPVTFDTIKLQPNKTYFASILLLDESKTPVDTISNEVEEEKDEHLFVFSNTANINITIKDFDNNNLPVGLASRWKTAAPITGASTIRLKHQPGIKNGDPSLGETDVEVVFPTAIEP